MFLVISIVDVILMGSFKVRINFRVEKPAFLVETENSIAFEKNNEVAKGNLVIAIIGSEICGKICTLFLLSAMIRKNFHYRFT